MQMQRKVYIINTELNPSELKFQAKNKAKKWLSVCGMCVCVCVLQLVNTEYKLHK